MPPTLNLSLKPGKERPLLQRHRWIFSGAIAHLPPFEEGDLATVFSAKGERLGLAILSKGRSIAGHLLAFGDEELLPALRKSIREAYAFRKRWIDPNKTQAFRLIHAEADGIPGLIVDSYDGHLVVQISHPGIDKLKSELLSLLIEEVTPKAIFEKSTSFLRKKGGLGEAKGLLYGTPPSSEVEILEEGLSYSVDLLEGQKTGLFLDQREARLLVRRLASGRSVLNCFAYTGGFSISALAGGALQVDSVEISAKCAPRLEKSLALNHLPPERHRFFARDVFEFLREEPLPYDLIILDPPAFVKRREDVKNAFRAYKELNRMTLEKMQKGSLLLTSSCSYHVGEELFQNILFRAASEAKREVKIVGSRFQALDHPISIFHPESVYLKTFLLSVE